MKAGLHPVYTVAKVVCACGNSFETRSTRESIRLDICSACHPFFTGTQRLVDTAGRVERFQKRFQATQGKTAARKPATARKIPKKLAPATPPGKVLTTAPRKVKPASDKKAPKPAKAPAKAS